MKINPFVVVLLCIIIAFASLMYKKNDTPSYSYSAPTIMETQLTDDIPTREEVEAERMANAKQKQKEYLKDLDNRVEVQTQKTAEAVESDIDR